MNEIQINLRINGMTCVNCSQHVERALEAVPGVKKVVVSDWQLGRARVIAEGNITPEELTEAVAGAGYTASIQDQSTLKPIGEVPGPGDS